MPPHEYRSRQIVKPPPAFFVCVAVAFLFPMVFAELVDLVGRAMRAMYPVGPTSPPDFVVTFAFIDEVVEAAHAAKI